MASEENGRTVLIISDPVGNRNSEYEWISRRTQNDALS